MAAETLTVITPPVHHAPSSATNPSTGTIWLFRPSHSPASEPDFVMAFLKNMLSCQCRRRGTPRQCHRAGKAQAAMAVPAPAAAAGLPAAVERRQSSCRVTQPPQALLLVSAAKQVPPAFQPQLFLK